MRMRTRIAENRKRKMLIAAAGLALVAAILGICVFLQTTIPYAVSQDGTRIQQPWTVKIGTQEAFVVASKQEGQAVVDGIKDHYSTTDTDVEKTSISPKITIEEKDLKRSQSSVQVTDADDAVDQIITAAEAGNPLVAVTTVDQVAKTETIPYGTEYKIDSSLQKDEKKILTKGREGGKLITSQVTRVNGKVLSEEVVSEKVTQEPTAMIVAKGDDSLSDEGILTGQTPEVTQQSETGASPQEETSASELENAQTNNAAQKDIQAAAVKESTSATQPAQSTTDAAADKPSSTGSTKEPAKDATQKPTSATTPSTTQKPETTAPTTKKPTESDKDKETKPSTTTNRGQQVADYALQFVGNPYVYGGTSLTNGADCSGFTMSVYAKFGVKLPHSSSAQRSSGRGVSYSQAKAGDIICYSGHVAIYIGNGQIVHASNERDGIKVSTATYKTILTVRRILE